MPIDIHGLAKRFESLPGLELPAIRESVKSYRSTIQGRKRELLSPFGLDNLDRFKDDPGGFVKAVDRALDSFREKKEQSAPYRVLYEDSRCLVTFTTKPEGAAAAGSHLKADGEVKCPWCICVKHPDNEKWWKEYKAAALAFIYAKDDACCIVLTARDSLDTIGGRFAFSQAEGIENKGLNDNPEEQGKVLERLYGKTGLSDSRMVEILRPVLELMRWRLEKTVLNESLLAAVRDRCAGRVKECLDLGADVDTPEEYDWTPLFLAAGRGYLEMCKLLLDAGADVNGGSKTKEPPLLAAVWTGHPVVCKLLIDAGANVEARDENGWTPLQWAASRGYLEMCKLLLDAGADVNTRSYDGNTPLLWAACRGDLEIVKLLIESGAAVNAIDKFGYSSLYSAAIRGHLEACKLLLDAGADVEAVDKDGNTPLNLLKNSKIRALLVSRGAEE